MVGRPDDLRGDVGYRPSRDFRRRRDGGECQLEEGGSGVGLLVEDGG